MCSCTEGRTSGKGQPLASSPGEIAENICVLGIMVISKRKHISPGPADSKHGLDHLSYMSYSVRSSHHGSLRPEGGRCLKVRRRHWKATHQSLPLGLADHSCKWYSSPHSRGAFTPQPRTARTAPLPKAASRSALKCLGFLSFPLLLWLPHK